MNCWKVHLVCWIVWMTAPALTAAAAPALLQVNLKGEMCQGKLITRDQEICWIMGRDGRLFRVKIDRIQKIEAIAPSFRKYTPAELRDLLRHEYGNGFEVVGTGHYLVCAPPAQVARYSRVFEEIYRSVHLYFSRRGFRIEEPEFPMVAVVFPNRAGFAEQSRLDGVRSGAGLLGYYHPDTNRVALFDSETDKTTDEETSASVDSPWGAAQSFEEMFEQFSRRRPAALLAGSSQITPREIFARQHAGEISADLKDTIVHEATHQVAFNIGLHSRIGENPKWVVEGLATAFEVAGMHTSAPTDSAKERINHGRFVWFTNFVQDRRKPKSLVDFVANDQLFAQSAPDAYAQAWALTFFLLESRANKYSGYLRMIAARDPRVPYTADERIADFRKAFGGEFDLLEAEFLRFVDRLK